MASKDAKDRKKSIEKKDTNNLIVEESGKNIFEQQVFDVLEYIEKEANFKNNSVAIKILKLKEYGITDKQIVEEYSKHGGTIENPNAAMDNLERVFVGLAEYINSLPNGIVIDFTTAEKNDKKSFEQAIQYGIDPEKNYINDLNNTTENQTEDSKKTQTSDKIEYLLENFKDVYIYDSEISQKVGIDIDEILNKNEDEMNLSDSLKKLLKESKEKIENSYYESDVHLFEICKLKVMLKEAENSQDYNLILGKITNFYKAHPEYASRDLPVLNQDGSLNQNEIIKMNEFSEAYQKLIILEHVDKFNGMTPQELANLDPNKRKHFMLCAFSGLKYENDEKKEHQELASESMKMIKQLYPNLDLNNGKELAEFFKEISGIDADFKSISLQELVGIYSRQLKEAAEDYLEKDTEVYIGKKIDFTKLDLDSSERMFFDSTMKNYFVGSNINFTAQDEQEYNKLYQDATIESWIENKENAIKLRYAALTTIRDEYKNNPAGTYTEKKLAEIEKAIDEFEKRFGKIDLTPKEDEVQFDVYRDDFMKAGITKYLTRDAIEWSQGVDYENLDSEHKKGYIRNIIVALGDNPDSNSYMTKIALRRLELMGNEFVQIHPNGEFIINEQRILEEYKSLSDYDYSNYEQLAESAKLRKNEYLLKKLEEYTNLPESSFVELTDRDNPETAIDQIEEARYLSNQKRIEQIVNGIGTNIIGNRETTRERKKVENSKAIPDDVMFDVFEQQGEELNVHVDGKVAGPQVPRDEVSQNQGGQDESNNGASTASEMKLEKINTTAIKEENAQDSVKPTFIENIRATFTKVGKSILKLIKREDKIKRLEAREYKDKNANEAVAIGMNKERYNDIFRPTEMTPKINTSGEKSDTGTARSGTEEIRNRFVRDMKLRGCL